MHVDRSKTRGAPLLALLIFMGLAAASAQNQSAGQEKQEAEAQAQQFQTQQFQTLIRSTAGPDLYRAYCASCHGADGKGHGPAAVALKSKVPNLTLLAACNRGQFPSRYARRVIMGDDVIAAHGSRAMPVWGPIFHQVEEDVDRGNVRLENLVKYLQSIQAAELPEPKAPQNTAGDPSGAELYKQHCAACHGDDLKGTGPPPEPYKQPPDLTTLAQRHEGKFPTAYVAKVLKQGVKIPAHGAADMPIWGETFSEAERLHETQIDARITALSEYIKSQQVK